jgi:hypothetical protein
MKYNDPNLWYGEEADPELERLMLLLFAESKARKPQPSDYGPHNAPDGGFIAEGMAPPDPADSPPIKTTLN